MRKTVWTVNKIVQTIFWATLIISNILIIAKAESPEVYTIDSTVQDITPEDAENSDEPVIVRGTYTGYEGSISSTYAEYFKGILYKKQPKHYVIARTNQYEFIMAYGDNLSYNNGVFSGNVDTVLIQTATYGTNFNIDYGHDSSFRLTPNENMLYSDLGDFPIINYETDGTMIKGGVYFVTVVVLAYFLYWIVRNAFTRTIKFY